MKIFKLSFQLQGVVSKLPDSQSIFGMLIENLKHIKKEDYIKNVLDNKLIIPSSMFYENTLPFPYDIVPDKVDIFSIEIRSLFKKLKKVKFIDIDLFNQYKKDIKLFNKELLNNLIKEKFIIKNSVLTTNKNNIDYSYLVETRVRNQVLVEEDTKLFYNNIIYFNNKTFDVYIKTKEEVFNDIIFSLNKMKYVYIGGKSSIGYNLFVINQEKSFEVKELNYNNTSKVLLSKAISIKEDHINFDNSYYQLLNLNNKFNNIDGGTFRKEIIAFSEGSIIDTKNDTIGDYIIEKGKINNTYQNYIGFLL